MGELRKFKSGGGGSLFSAPGFTILVVSRFTKTHARFESLDKSVQNSCLSDIIKHYPQSEQYFSQSDIIKHYPQSVQHFSQSDIIKHFREAVQNSKLSDIIKHFRQAVHKIPFYLISKNIFNKLY